MKIIPHIQDGGIVLDTKMGEAAEVRFVWAHGWDEEVTLTIDEARALRDQLTALLPATRTPADVLTDPQPGIARRLSVDVRGDFRLADASKWRARLTRADLKDSALSRALFSFTSASTSNADQIAKTIAWLDDNPGHPFIVRISDTVRISDAPPPAA